LLPSYVPVRVETPSCNQKQYTKTISLTRNMLYFGTEILCTICSFGGKANCHLKVFGQKLVVVAGGPSQANGIVL